MNGTGPGAEPEQHWLVRARSGDPDAWEVLYRRTYPGLFAFARRRLASQEQAEDAVSETMARAMGKIHDYRPGSSGVAGWLFGIARNVVLEAYRAGARQQPTDPAHLVNVVEVGSTDPAVAVLDAEERAQMAKAFARLPESDRELLEMRVVVGLDSAQVAELVAKRAGAVRTAQSRALQRLRIEFQGLMA